MALLVIGDSDIVTPEHAVAMIRLLGGGVPGDLASLPRSRLAVIASYLAFTRDLGSARDLAYRTTLMVGNVLGLQQMEELPAALLEGALDDFTHADLSLIDLAGCHLTGIRWSEHGTTWPPGTDTDELRARSQEIAPGIYEITRPGHGDKTRHHVAA